MERFIITGSVWVAVSRMVVFAVTARALIFQGQFSCVVVLIMFACSSSGGGSFVPQEPWYSKDSWWWPTHVQRLMARLCVMVFLFLVPGIVVLYTFLACVAALAGSGSVQHHCQSSAFVQYF